MKVVDILKHKSESLAKHPFEIKERMSPALREYWHDFINRTTTIQVLDWVREHASAVNEEVPLQQEENLNLNEAAQALYEELQEKLDEVIHVGDWIIIDQARINAFAEVTEDTQWIHTDPERAVQESPFKTTIAHGFLTLSMLSRMTDSVDPENPQFPTARMVVNVGLNQVRFPYPVKAGNRLRTHSKLLKVTPINRGLELEREMTVEIEGVRRPGCIAVSVIRLYF
ncbi:dehydratase [Vibrio sp. HA2012]|uniref:MaoC family dehydratase n=1 Tax=Vibrio sp. HA2012 TaxID=1971595 RepID=UPI000C2C922B|nr:MaoC family dehydratase [Vibrio sp. HA2012]PJC87486.1 dehydratase [Vibrio sp. HA2012]